MRRPTGRSAAAGSPGRRATGAPACGRRPGADPPGRGRRAHWPRRAGDMGAADVRRGSTNAGRGRTPRCGAGDARHRTHRRGRRGRARTQGSNALARRQGPGAGTRGDGRGRGAVDALGWTRWCGRRNAGRPRTVDAPARVYERGRKDAGARTVDALVRTHGREHTGRAQGLGVRGAGTGGLGRVTWAPVPGRRTGHGAGARTWESRGGRSGVGRPAQARGRGKAGAGTRAREGLYGRAGMERPVRARGRGKAGAGGGPSGGSPFSPAAG